MLLCTILLIRPVPKGGTMHSFPTKKKKEKRLHEQNKKAWIRNIETITFTEQTSLNENGKMNIETTVVACCALTSRLRGRMGAESNLKEEGVPFIWVASWCRNEGKLGERHERRLGRPGARRYCRASLSWRGTMMGTWWWRAKECCQLWKQAMKNN